jgi:hypothetical protein
MLAVEIYRRCIKYEARVFFELNSSVYDHNSAWREADNGFYTNIHKLLKT